MLVINNNAICQNAITEWLVLGSFPVDTLHTSLETTLLAEENTVYPQADQQSGELKWQAIKTLPSGIVDFRQISMPQYEHCVVYSATYIYSSSEQNIILSIGSDDGYALWLNDRLVAKNLVFRGLVKGNDSVPVRLSHGWNRLLFKNVNDTGSFGLCVDLLNTKGEPLSDSKFSSEKPASIKREAPQPYAYIDNYGFGPSFIKNKKRYYPFSVTIKNLGKPGHYSGKITIDTRLRPWTNRNYSLDQVQKLDFTFNSNELWSKINRPAGIRLTLNGRRCDNEIFTLEPEMVLVSLFQSDSLPENIRPYKNLFAQFQTNLEWYKHFRGEPFDYQPSDLADCIDHALHCEWVPFENMLTTLFADLIDFSHTIKQDTLHMIGQSHIDMAWLWRWPETIDICKKTYESALNFLDEEPEFKYIQSQAASFVWMEEKYPDLFKRIQQAVADKRFFIVGGMWVEPDLNLSGGEALVRQILYGKRYFSEKFGVDCITGYTPDTFGYTWSLPQILVKSGFQYFVTTKLRWNDTTTFPHSIFNWVSADGSSITTCIPNGLNVENKPKELAEKMVQFKSEGFNTVPVLYGVGDHGGGPTRQHFNHIRDLQSIGIFPTLYHNDLDNYMQQVEYKYPDLPRHQDELYLEYHRGTLTTQGKVKKQNRQSEIALEESEKLAIFAGIDWPLDSLNTAWKLALFNQFHDILPGSSIPEVYDDADVDYARVEKITTSIIDSSMAAIAADIDLNEKHIPVVVFNTLNWQRNGEVSVPLPPDTEIKEVYDDDDNKMPYHQQDSSLVFMAKDIPACGYKVFWLRNGKNKNNDNDLKIGPTFLENKLVRVEINPVNGNISRMFDKKNKREIIANGKEANVLQFWEDQPDEFDAWNISYTGKSENCHEVNSIFIKEKGPVKAVLRVIRHYNNSTFTQDYTLHAGSARLDIVTHADWHEQHILCKAVFPVNVKTDFATYDIAYGSIQRPTNPQTPEEKAKWEVSAHKYIDMSNAEYGLTLMNDCKYGHDVQDNVMRLTLLRSPLTPDPYSKPDGYQAPFADQGEHEFTYSIWPHNGDQLTANSVRQAYELNYPLKSQIMERQKGDAPRQNSFLSVNKENIIVTAVKKAEDSNATVIRLYETHGWPAETEITLQKAVSRAWKADLMENKLEPLTVTNNMIEYSVAPNEIATIIVE